MDTNVNFMIRAQAQNGMLLGPDSYNGAIISITNKTTGALLAKGLMDTGDSGTRTSGPSAWTSPYTIMTPTQPPTQYWVLADATSVGYAVTLQLAAPTLLEISAHEPLPEGQDSPTASITVEAAPGDDFSQAIGLIVPIPGLWVQPELISLGNLLRVRAKVTMMCGCEINTGTPWIPTDFEVSALVIQTAPMQRFIGTYDMTFQVNSQFYANIDLPSPTGSYQIVINASQISSKMMGTATARW